MLKKLTLAAAALAVSSTVVAGNMGVPCPTYNYLVGPYIGGSIGPLLNTSGAPANYYGFTGTLSGGWGMIFNQSFYLAGEVFGGSNIKLRNLPNHHIIVPPGGPEVTVQSSWFYGVDAIPGILLTDHVLGYVRAGGIWANFNGVGVQNKSGWQVGPGLQTNILGNIDLRGEYVYSQFDGNLSPFIGKVAMNQVNVGLVYKFV